METAPLKAFATSARTELIREVTARITAVLGQGSPERVESPATVASLEKEVAARGGGDKGKAHVADKVAYTWFNRIIALRFMDANGYTGIGVVSPATDQIGQPEVLGAAKRGQIDKEVVSNDRNIAAIASLLNGTRQPRQGVDAQAEAYALLLAAYCQFWHKAMPFMFERQGDFTELLIPANLLAGDSALNRSVEVLSEDACKDVEVIGWLYQFYISERKDEVFAGFKKNGKAGADEIPAATQLFTPHWIVRYLVENSVGRLWMLNRPASRLIHQMDYYIAPVDEETDFLKVVRPEDLKVIDPACGSGHMLTYAFDLLCAIYEEEGYTPSEIPSLILANNLYGIEIDARAGALAAFALTMKAAARRKLFLKNPVEPKVCVLDPIKFVPNELDLLRPSTNGCGKPLQGSATLDLLEPTREEIDAFWNQFQHADTFGSLIRPDADLIAPLRAHVDNLDDSTLGAPELRDAAERVLDHAEYLSQRYHVAIANPPYMGGKQMNALLSQFMKDAYPDVKQDLYGAFVLRGIELTDDAGLLAIVIGDTWMSIKTFGALRLQLLNGHAFDSFVHMRDVSNHPDIFGANAAFVLSMAGNRNRHAPFVRLTPLGSERKERDLLIALAERTKDAGYHLASGEDFAAIPGSPIVYWLSEKMRGTFASGRPLSDVANLRQGLATADNNRFLRQWWEVSGTRCALACTSREEAAATRARWFPYNKGGEFRKWYGNQEFVVNWENDGAEIRTFGTDAGGRPRSRAQNTDTYFSPSVAWSDISSSEAAFRRFPSGFIHDVKGMSAFGSAELLDQIAVLMNSSMAREILKAIAPTLNFQVGDVGKLPVNSGFDELPTNTSDLVATSKEDWDLAETSWEFARNPLVELFGSRSLKTLKQTVSQHREEWAGRSLAQQQLEIENNRAVAKLYELEDEVPSHVPLERVSLTNNSAFRWPNKTPEERDVLFAQSAVVDLVSYAVGCMFGRYSLDDPGLILAHQGSTLQDYLAKGSSPIFTPDADNVIPIVDGDWFKDDIVGRFRQFLRVAFGEKHFEDNLSFVAEALGVRNLRDYFITKTWKSKFYDDHVQRYKKRPIYWLFSSPKGSFNALIYLHRYTPSTASTVLTYLREYLTKLESSLQQAERIGNAKEADRLRKILLELNEYEHDTLYPMASESVVIDLDDGVKVNYQKLGGVLRKIAGLESSGD